MLLSLESVLSPLHSLLILGRDHGRAGMESLSDCDVSVDLEKQRTKLFLAVEPEVTYYDHYLAYQCYPERRRCHW